MLLCYEKVNIINTRILYVHVGFRIQELTGIISGMAAMDFRDSNAVPSQRVVQIQFSTVLIALRPSREKPRRDGRARVRERGQVCSWLNFRILAA